MPISATNLNKAYLAYFGRPADAVGQAYFATLEQADVIKAFDASAESKAIYGGDTAAKINAIYKNLFNREAEPAGLTYWLSLVSSGRVTPAGAAFSILEGAQGTDKTAIDNKLAASEAFIKAMDTTTEIVNYSGLNAAASARAFLATVDASAASLTAAVAGAQAAVTSAISTTQGNDYGVSLQLTRNRDSTDATAQGANVIASTSGNDSYTGTVDPANSFNNTVNNDDYIDGAQGNDTLTLALLGSNTSNARVKNIENLVLGTNVLGGVTYDLNINAGGQQTTGYQTIAADRIIDTEALTISNVFKGSTDTALPKLIWDNASNTTPAGTVNYNYLSGQVTGTTDTQSIDLRSVNAGTINIAPGIETFNVNSGTGINPTLNGISTEANTLGTTVNGSNPGTGANADLASGTTLTKVVVTGGANFGAAAGIAATGLTDRALQTNNDNAVNAAANDRGLTTGATAANLVSLSNTVITYDATTATGAQNVMFTAKASGAETNVTFIGGTAGDYAEFQVGNINAAGGEGNDTFAFVNTGFNSTFTTADTIAGGTGIDTIQLGLNGNATPYDVQWTEFNNKTGIDVLDLRGNSNKVELSDTFVAATDATAGFTVRTDKIVQTSATSVANPAGGSTAEDASENTIILTKLASNRVITFEGGSGSDRLVLNENSFTSNATLRGGDNVNNAGSAAPAAARDYDTLTVVDNAVLSRGDLSKTSGFEGLNLVKSDATSGRQFSIELTEAFLLANTQATDNATATNIDDRAFQIGSVAAANANALNALDTVTIDVTDLFTTNNSTLKTSLTGRYVDLTSLNASGAAVRFNYNGQSNLTQAQLAALVNTAVVTTADVGGTANVLGGVAVAGVITGVVYASGIGAQATLGTNNNDTFTLTQADTVAGGTGADTVNLNAGSAAAQVTLGAGADTINVNVVVAGAGGLVTTVAGSTVNVNVNQAGLIGAGDITGATIYNVTTAQTVGFGVENVAGHTINASAGGLYVMGAAGQVFVGTGTVAQTVTTGAGSDTVTLNGSGSDIVVASAGADTIALNSGADQVRFTAPAQAVNHLISGFTAGIGGDSLSFDDPAGGTFALAGAALSFASGTAAVVGAQALDAANVNVMVVTGQAYASYATAEAALNAAGRTENDGQVVVFFNQTTSTAQVVYDTTAAAGGDTVVATLVGYTLADLANLTSANFFIV